MPRPSCRRALERRRKCSCSNSFSSCCKFTALFFLYSTSDARKRNHLDVSHHNRLRRVYNLMMSSRANHSRCFRNRSLKFILTQVSRLKLRTRLFVSLSEDLSRLTDSVSLVDSTEWRFEWRSHNRPLKRQFFLHR